MRYGKFRKLLLRMRIQEAGTEAGGTRGRLDLCVRRSQRCGKQILPGMRRKEARGGTEGLDLHGMR